MEYNQLQEKTDKIAAENRIMNRKLNECLKEIDRKDRDNSEQEQQYRELQKQYNSIAFSPDGNVCKSTKQKQKHSDSFTFNSKSTFFFFL